MIMKLSAIVCQVCVKGNVMRTCNLRIDYECDKWMFKLGSNPILSMLLKKIFKSKSDGKK